MKGLMLLVAVVGVYLGSSRVESGCVESKMCCEGKDNKCRAIGPRMNGSNHTTCFCDSACLPLGDCCTDYRDVCHKVDCVLAEDWDPWGECDVRCGMGAKQRTKRVIQRPKNGGEPCGQTVQKTVCQGSYCKVARAPGLAEEIRETGRILPIAMADWRRSKVYNPFQDIRRNLFEKNYGSDPHAPENRPPYCARYQITDVRKACEGLANYGFANWAKDLTKGAVVCVECQGMAMQDQLGGRCRGHGAYLKETRWSAVALPGCHGAWVMTSKREDCSCSNYKSDLSFIFV